MNALAVSFLSMCVYCNLYGLEMSDQSKVFQLTGTSWTFNQWYQSTYIRSLWFKSWQKVGIIEQQLFI